MAPWRSLVSKNYSSCYSTNSEQSVASCSTCISISSVPSPGENSETARRLVLGQKKEKGRRKRRLVCGGETGPVHGNYAHSKRVSPCCRRRRWMKIITRPSSCNLGRRLFRFRDRESKKGGRRGERKEEIRHFLDATLGLIKRKTSALFLCGLFWDVPSLLFEGRDDNRGNEAREKKRRWFPRGTKLFADDSREFFNSSILWTTFFAKLLPEELSYLSIQFFVIAINVYRWSSGLYHYIKIYF